MTGPTVPTPAVRYFQPGTTKYLVVPTWAEPKTIANIDAGTDISHDVAAVSGFTKSVADLPTPDLNSRFVPNVAGRITADQCSMDFYADEEGDDIRSVLTEDQETNIVRFTAGLGASKPMDSFPVRVASISLVPDLEAVPVVRVVFTVTDVPELGLTYPAS